ncbi:hypothetical protein KP509_28G029400 [Ceratopteris richardii]|uniref:Uncharacterized protein n=1 Tax=Ceratopteris richardii TaxID=49495 RepID=A0A8T2RCG5_CERRI|nr:hypothetical protein KP509_28G029400 [Ceratopteris richardii]
MVSRCQNAPPTARSILLYPERVMMFLRTLRCFCDALHLLLEPNSLRRLLARPDLITRPTREPRHQDSIAAARNARGTFPCPLHAMSFNKTVHHLARTVLYMWPVMMLEM